MDVEEYKYDQPSRKRKYAQKSRPKRFRRYSRVPRPLNGKGQVHIFKQTITGVSMAFANDNFSQLVAGQGFMIYVTLNMFPQGASFAGLFDLYRIKKLTLRLMPQKLFVVDASIAASGPSGAIVTAIDTDGTAAPLNLNDILQYDSCKMQQCHNTRPIIRTCTPKTLGYAFDPVLPGPRAAASFRNSQWLDTSLRDVAYYGFPLWIEPYNSVQTSQSWRVFMDVILHTKNVR